MFIHPGKLFVSKYGVVQDQEGILRYVDFLRQESGLGVNPPINLAKIYNRFDMPAPILDQLDQEGLLLDPEHGLIIIKEDDPRTRRRFSEAHELIEMLITSLPLGKDWSSRQHGVFSSEAKEKVCNAGAAELLMPRATFVPHMHSVGISFHAAREGARKYFVSTTAVLVHIARVCKGRHAIVLWRLKNKPTELRNRVSSNQIALFPESTPAMPEKKLRVEWSFTSPNSPYIPRDKSVPNDSSIYAAWNDNAFTIGESVLDLGSFEGKVQCESYPFEREGERMVISLIHLPGDLKCKAETTASLN